MDRIFAALSHRIASWAGQDTGTETSEREPQGGLGGLIASLIPRGGRKAAPQPDTLLAEKGGAAALAPEEDRGAFYHFDGAPLAGRHVLVTAGPTHEPIDPVRYIANRSSGKQGFAIAEAAAATPVVIGQTARDGLAGFPQDDVADDTAHAAAAITPTATEHRHDEKEEDEVKDTQSSGWNVQWGKQDG